jgi:hypothetical protein
VGVVSVAGDDDPLGAELALEHDELGLAGDRSSLLSPCRAASDDASVDEDEPRRTRGGHVTNQADFRLCMGDRAVTSRVVCSGRMAAATASSPHSLATASGLLLGTTGLAMGVGALLGWLFDAAAIGLLIGAIAGIPLAVAVVYAVYSRAGA